MSGMLRNLTSLPGNLTKIVAWLGWLVALALAITEFVKSHPLPT